MLTILKKFWESITLYVMIALAVIAAYFGITGKFAKARAAREKGKRQQAEYTGHLSEARREVAEASRQRDTEEVKDAAAGRRNQLEKDW